MPALQQMTNYHTHSTYCDGKASPREMVDFACQVKPQDVCLVPERREEVTTEGGLDVVKHYHEVEAAVKSRPVRVL